MDGVYAVVRSMMSPDAGADPLDQYEPATPDVFSVFVEFEIGPSEGAGSDLFGLTVCSPQWLAEQQRPGGFEFLAATLVLDRWNAASVERAVSDLCRRTSGVEWGQVAESLSRYLAWEFADYRVR